MKKIKMLVAALLIPLGMLPLAANAQQDTGSGLSISPTRTDLIVQAGTSADLTISLKNVTGGDIVARAFLNDFESDGVTGEPRLITNSDEQSASSIRDFLVGLEDVRLQQDETREINLQVAIPEGAFPGAYFGAIRYQAIPLDEQGRETDGGQVALSASVGTLVLVEVPGQVNEQIEIKSISAYLDDDKGSIFTQKPDQVGVEINNIGNGFARPFGKVYVTDMFGNELVNYELNNTNPRGVVLPESTRVFRDFVDVFSSPGRYTLSADISYTNGGEVYSISSTVWYLPAWFIMVIIAVILLLLTIGVLLYRKFVTRPIKRRK